MTPEVEQRIKDAIEQHKVVLYMKGSPSAPQCGFSAQVVNILANFEVPFAYSNVLEDQGVREGIKAFSDWPTIPQLYVNGEFVGGCDIVTEMYESGELATLLATATEAS